MELAVALVFGLMLGALLGGLLGMVLHERRDFARQDAKREADERREREAIDRHGTLMAALESHRKLTIAAVNQRDRLGGRTEALERALNDHADHLEALGISSPARVQVGDGS